MSMIDNVKHGPVSLDELKSYDLLCAGPHHWVRSYTSLFSNAVSNPAIPYVPIKLNKTLPFVAVFQVSQR